jgi:hypothetical protein
LFFVLQGKQEWLDLKDGWPEYIDELDRMFSGVAVMGDTSFVPRVNHQINFISSGEEEEDDDAFGIPHSCATPVSSGSKRTTSSTRNTATSPSKKTKSAVVRNMNNNMTRFNSSYDHRTEVMQNIWMAKNHFVEHERNIKKQQQDIRKQKQKLVADSATELGVHLMEEGLWIGVVNICKDDDARNIFLCTPAQARLQMIKSYATMV